MRLGLNLLALRLEQGAGVDRFARNVVGSMQLGSGSSLWVGIRAGADLKRLLGKHFLESNEIVEISTWRCRRTAMRLFIEMVCMCTKTFSLDVVLSINNFGPLLGKFGQRRIVVIHDIWFLESGYEGHWLRKYLFGMLIRMQLLSTTHIVTISEFSKRAIVSRLNVDKQMVSVVPNCLPSTIAIVDDSAAVDDAGEDVDLVFPGKYLLMIGSDRPNKNIWRGLQGYIEFARTRTGFPALCIVGHYSDAFQAKLASAVPERLSSRVDIRGFVGDVEYQRLISGCTGVLFPSLYEGFGIPVAEAVSQGKHVLVSQGTVCEEVAGPFGIAVDTKDIFQVSSAIVKLLDQTDAVHSEEFSRHSNA
tara:strand:+ start:754 stop:1836 length:1083 start_codon:yes stop_codon:yes gene_type:complete